jgi:hypothetical protein
MKGIRTAMNMQQTLPQIRPNLLRRALLGNAIFSVLTGFFLLFDATPIGAALGVGNPLVLQVMGALIVLFAAEVAWIALREPLNRQHAQIILALDVAWVVASAIVLLLGLLPFTSAGQWGFVIVADIVACFAILEWIGLRRMQAEGSA